MSWIKFHGEIRKGKHRGIPRALRFVFLELAHEARPGRGVIELPAGMGLVDGVHDVLGGDRREVARAVELYTTGPDRDAPSLIVEGQPGALRLRIPSWEAWNRVDDSAERTRKYREKVRGRASCDASRASHDTVTTSQAGDDARVTVTALDKRRGDQIRSDPPLPPAGGSAAPDGAPPEPKPERRGKGPSAEQRYREAFVAGIHEGAPGQPYALGGRIGSTLGPALAEHAREGGAALAGAALDAWIRVTVARWRRTADAAYAGGWSVFAFVKWLNAGQPAGLLNGARVSTVQPVPATGRLWKMGEEV